MTKPKPIKIILITLFVLLCLFALFLDHYPDYYGATHAPPGQAYMGQVSWFDPWDMNVYISAIRWGSRDGWFFKNVYTTIDQPPAPIFHIYLLLGKIGTILHQSPQMMFHAGAIVLSIPFLLFLVYFTRYFTRSKPEWLLAFFFCVLGGGLGWWLYPHLPIPDVYVPGFTIATALHRPHEALSSLFYIALMLFSYRAIVQDLNSKLEARNSKQYQNSDSQNSKRFDHSNFKHLNFFRISYFVFRIYPVIGLLTFLLSFQHPYMLLPYFLVLGVFSLYILKVRPFGHSRTDVLRHLIPVYAVTFGASALYLLFSFKLFITNPSFTGLLAQIQQSANPFLMMLGYGILAPFIIMKLIPVILGRSKSDDSRIDEKVQFLRLWFLVQFATLYLPLGFQRLLIRGLLYPAFVLAAMGVVETMRKKNRLALILLILLVPLSSLYMFRRRIEDIPNLNRWMYLTLDEKAAFDFLDTQTPKERTILASYRISNHLPPHTDSWVFAGHEFQSPDFYNRQKEVQRFYGGKMSEEEMKDWLSKNNIQYIFFGPEEQQIGNGSFIGTQFLEEIFRIQKVAIYQRKI